MTNRDTSELGSTPIVGDLPSIVLEQVMVEWPYQEETTEMNVSTKQGIRGFGVVLVLTALPPQHAHNEKIDALQKVVTTDATNATPMRHEPHTELAEVYVPAFPHSMAYASGVTGTTTV